MKALVESLQYNVVQFIRDKLSVGGKNVFSRNSELSNDFSVWFLNVIMNGIKTL